MTQKASGYAADIPYLRDFKPMLAPAWLDHVALVAGVEPPTRREGFAWCDLGCGQGVTAAILAATHPAGAFHGVDAMPTHIDHARRLAAEATIDNVRFHAMDFATAMDREMPLFDYIVAHGVYTWIDRDSQAALRGFIDRRLKPGGLVYLSYNALPGWSRDLPFQRLVGELSRSIQGNDVERFAAAVAIARTVAGSGATALAASFIMRELNERPEDYPPAYLVHEFMPTAWQPLYVTEVRSAMATIGLTPVGSATLNENFDWLVLAEKARETLAPITDVDTRELVRDFYLDQRFRRDVFARDNRRLDRDERAYRLLASAFALGRPLSAIRYAVTTPAGAMDFDKPAVRTIIGALAAGARSAAEVLKNLGTAEDLDAILTLCAAGHIMPVEPGHARVSDLNRILFGRVDGPEEICWLALPCGTALEADRGLLRMLRDSGEIDDDQFPGWRDLMTAHGV